MHEFDHRLYWIGYRQNPPSADVISQILTPDKFAFHVAGYDADGFFSEVAERLRCFPPDILVRPFTHLKTVYTSLEPPKVAKLNVHLDTGRQLIDRAVDDLETEGYKRTIRLEALIQHGLYDDARKELNQGKALSANGKDLLMLSYLHQAANAIVSDELADVNQAVAEYCDKALASNRDDSAFVFRVWGDLLYQHAAGLKDTISTLNKACAKSAPSTQKRTDRARIRESEQRDALLRKAIAICNRSAQVKQGAHEAYFDRGTALDLVARRKQSEREPWKLPVKSTRTPPTSRTNLRPTTTGVSP